ncbi:hypothetical protein NEOLEDRAFT_1150852 [Neolentinus lepideus HHB14362 ss-1]|uniref:Uncharacterized protein n=1 Tax=Neolentinus lepideus HHB14362 ss-1 TaxID=1314782 RepID=A0A165PKD8_9AGAM|nr:hypothetical protein NEOLEDRAFT_1150852 [Neolentinus lepideus HHB14362 ss-1]
MTRIRVYWSPDFGTYRNSRRPRFVEPHDSLVGGNPMLHANILGRTVVTPQNRRRSPTDKSRAVGRLTFVRRLVIIEDFLPSINDHEAISSMGNATESHVWLASCAIPRSRQPELNNLRAFDIERHGAQLLPFLSSLRLVVSETFHGLGADSELGELHVCTEKSVDRVKQLYDPVAHASVTLTVVKHFAPLLDLHQLQDATIDGTAA